MSSLKYAALVTTVNGGLGFEFTRQFAMNDYEPRIDRNDIYKRDGLHRLPLLVSTADRLMFNART